MISADLIKKDFISIDKEDPISKLIGKFRVSKKAEAIVLDGKKYAGITSKRKMLKSRIRAYEEKVKGLIMKPSVLSGSESLGKTAQLMNSSDVHMLPVVKNNAVKGVVYAIDVLKNLVPVIGEKRVSDVSKGKVISIDEHTSISQTMNIMRMRKIDRAPLVNARNKLSGIVSIVDLVLKYSIFPVKRAGGSRIPESRSTPQKERDSSTIPVIHDATVDVVTVMRDCRIKTVIKLMIENRISDVVVIDEYSQPIGIITFKDLLKLF